MKTQDIPSGAVPVGTGLPPSRRERVAPPRPAPLPEGETIDVPALVASWERGDIDLLCVMGPTASGKTAYAVRLARQVADIRGRKPGAEILSADSRQVYRGMDIGTGKDRQEYGEVPVHLLDLAEPGEIYNIYRYQQDFLQAYRAVKERGSLPILCGGSGLYVEAVTRSYRFDIPSRRGPNARHRSDPLPGEGDAAALQALPAARPLPGLPEKTFYIATFLPREERCARIDARLDARLEAGMVEEVRGLLERGVPPETMLAYGLEYGFVTRYLQGELSYGQMRERLSIAIHQFSKRQMTWLRGMERDGITLHWVRV